MTRRTIYDLLLKAVAPLYDAAEAASVAALAAEELYGVGRRELILDADGEVEDFDAERFDRECRQLAEGCPVQYVTGSVEFCGLKLHVKPSVLIPRRETEELVAAVATEYRGRAPHILDIGTGSGAIAVALAAALPEARLTAIDISAAALEVAAANATACNAKVEFRRTDILTEELDTERFDAIVSNPPYVLESERPAMLPNVKDYEPAGALFVPDDDPLRFYNRIALLALKALRRGGTLWFEINERFGGEVTVMLNEKGYDEIGIQNDMNRKPRIARCRRS